MIPALQQFLAVFAGTLPLVGVIAWAAIQQNAGFDRMERHFDELAKDLKALGIRHQ